MTEIWIDNKKILYREINSNKSYTKVEDFCL